MSTWDGNNHYYSGQGVVLVGDRDPITGKPVGLLSVGNVSDLKIAVATTVLEHKESQTGQRGIDLRLTTEIKCTLSMTMENFIAANLATALRGNTTHKLAGTVSNEALNGYLGLVMPLENLKVSGVVVTRGATTLVAYVDDQTPWDYKVNPDAGSIMLNDGAGVAVSALTTGGVAPTAIAVGNPTVVTVANTAAVGSKVVITGLAGADAALLNGKAFEVVAASGASVSLNVNTTGRTITLGTPLTFFDGIALEVDYSYADQNQVEALTKGSQEKFMRFEGLNTADTNQPVIIEVFKFSVDPLKELAMISDTVQQFVLEGNVLADPLRTSGSKYFRERLLR
jgi:hypothetical protein